MSKGDVETFHEHGLWMNRREVIDDKPWGLRDTKEEAAAIGRGVAKAEKVEHIVRNLDGTIDERTSYGHDARRVRG